MTDVQIAHPTAETQPQPARHTTSHAANEGATLIERLLGLTAALTLSWCCMELEGGNPAVLLQFMPIALVSAITLGGMIMSHGPRLVARLIAVCFGAAAHNNEEVALLRSLCQRGRRLAYMGALIQMISGTVHVLSILDTPELLGPGIAVSLTAFVFAPLLAELGFGSIEHWITRSTVPGTETTHSPTGSAGRTAE